MSEGEQYYRDIFAGMVAEALNQDGYFGSEYRLYAFWGRMNKQTTLEADEDEVACAQRCCQLLAQGAMVSEIASRGVRTAALGAQNKQALYDRFSTEIGQALSEAFLAEVQAMERLRVDERSAPLLSAYVKKHRTDSCKREALAGLLAQAKRCRRLADETYRQLASQLPRAEPVDERGKIYYGFLWKDQAQWRAYSNGYLPTVLQKWQAFGKQKRLTTPIVSQSYPYNQLAAGQMKSCFEQTLQQVLDTAYLELCESLLTF